MYFRIKIYFKMAISTTKISKNGQIVIPSEIRKEAGINVGTTFLIYVKNGEIMLVREEKLRKQMGK